MEKMDPAIKENPNGHDFPMNRNKYLVILICIFLTFSACTDHSLESKSKDMAQSSQSHQANTNSYQQGSSEVDEVFNTLAMIFNLHSQETKKSLQVLESSISQYLSSPDEDTREKARSAWVDAHYAWTNLRLFSLNYRNHIYSDGMMESNSDEVKFIDQLLFMIDVSTIQPGFLDNMEGYPESGLVMDRSVNITEKALREQNGITSVEEISLGFHPIEYFLWQRDVKDFLPHSEDIIVKRRRLMIVALISLLIKDCNRYIETNNMLLDVVISEINSENKAILLLGLAKSALSELKKSLESSDALHAQFNQLPKLDFNYRKKIVSLLINKPINISSVMRGINSAATTEFLISLEDIEEIEIPEVKSDNDINQEIRLKNKAKVDHMERILNRIEEGIVSE